MYAALKSVRRLLMQQSKLINIPLPYQPTSSRLWNWSVIFGMAVAMIELSVVKIQLFSNTQHVENGGRGLPSAIRNTLRQRAKKIRDSLSPEG